MAPLRALLAALASRECVSLALKDKGREVSCRDEDMAPLAAAKDRSPAGLEGELCWGCRDGPALLWKACVAAELPGSRLAGSADGGRLAWKAWLAAELPQFSCWGVFFSLLAFFNAAPAEPTASRAALAPALVEEGSQIEDDL